MIKMTYDVTYHLICEINTKGENMLKVGVIRPIQPYCYGNALTD